MSGNARAEFEIKSWDEEPYAEFDGTEKLTRATVVAAYTGDLIGESRIDWLMYYGPGEDPVHYVGLERFTATIGGRSGTFAVQSQGMFAGGVPRTSWFVVPGSGTGELAGLRGQGTYAAQEGEPRVPVTFEYSFEE